MQKYSIFTLARNAMSYHKDWQRAWRSPQPKAEYDIIIVGAGLSLLLLVTGQPDKQSGAVLTFNWKLLIAFLVLMALYGVC